MVNSMWTFGSDLLLYHFVVFSDKAWSTNSTLNYSRSSNSSWEYDLNGSHVPFSSILRFCGMHLCMGIADQQGSPIKRAKALKWNIVQHTGKQRWANLLWLALNRFRQVCSEWHSPNQNNPPNQLPTHNLVKKIIIVMDSISLSP